MTLAEIQQALYDRLGYSPNPSPDVVRRILGYINDTNREILTKKWAYQFRRMTVQFTTFHPPYATLPIAVSRIHTIQDRNTGRNLTLKTLADIRQRDPRQTGLAIPDSYAVVNLAAPLSEDPPSVAAGSTPTPSVVFALFTNPADTMQFSLEGVDIVGARLKSLEAVRNSIPSIVSAVNWQTVTKARLVAPPVGDVNICYTLDGVTAGIIGTILAGQTQARYTRILLSPVGQGTLHYYADVDAALLNLAIPTDESLIHPDFHWLLTCGALRLEYIKREKTVLIAEERDRFNKGVAELQDYISAPQGAQTGPAARNRAPSQLGSSFPAGS